MKLYPDKKQKTSNFNSFQRRNLLLVPESQNFLSEHVRNQLQAATLLCVAHGEASFFS